MNTIGNIIEELALLPSEQNNKESEKLDRLSAVEIAELMNSQDALVVQAVRSELEHIAAAAERIAVAFADGGRLIYVGAGTSGRLGILDASECPPTFGTDPNLVVGRIAGGERAVFAAVEGAEDDEQAGVSDLQELDLSSADVVCGIAASGRTPYVRGALRYAAEVGAYTILLTTNTRENIKKLAFSPDIAICPSVGAEVLAGSTRLKSGTAQKMVLNMLTTIAMVLQGKVFGNVMVDLQLSNIKLKARAIRTVVSITGLNAEEAEQLISRAGGHVKTALCMELGGVGQEQAKLLLAQHKGYLRKALEAAQALQIDDK